MLEELETLVTPSLTKENVELVDLSFQKEHGGWTLRFYLDKSGGFSLKDCEIWSQLFEQLLDSSDLIKQPYVLEVSSPGIDRPLKKLGDFQKFSGQRAHIRLYAPMDGQKNFHGTLRGTHQNDILLETDEKREIVIPHKQIAKAKLDPEIKFNRMEEGD